MTDLEMRAFEKEEHPVVAAVAARALRDSPTTVASFGDDPLVRLDHGYRTYRMLFGMIDPPQLAAFCGECAVGVAAVSKPGQCVGGLFGPFAAETLAKPVPDYGDPAREQVFWAECAEHDLPEEHWHFGPVGVEPGFQGTGIGTAMMRRLCDELDRDRQIGWLETDKEINVRFYIALGFEVVEEASILDVPCWFMRRDPT